MGSTLCSIMNENLSFNLEKGITFIENESKQVYISYSELKLNALKTLGYLQNRGIKRGDELILQIKDNYDYIDVFWACLFGGIIAVPVSVGNNDEHKGKLFKIWETLNNPFIISDEKTFLNLEEYSVKSDKKSLYEEINLGKITISDIKNYPEPGIEEIPLETDIAFIQFSSGSTGDPKGVVLTHANLVANTKAIIAGAEMEISDILLSWMPLTHDMGLIGVHLTGSVLNAN